MVETVHLTLFLGAFVALLFIAYVINKRCSRFRAIQKGDECGLFIDNESTVDIIIDVVVDLVHDKRGDLYAIRTASGREYTILDYVVGKFRLIDDD